MRLKVKSLKLLTGRPIAIIHQHTAGILSVAEGGRIRIRNAHSVVAVVNIAEGILKEDEISLSAEILNHLGLKEGQEVDVAVEPPPKSTHYIVEKLHGKRLSKSHLEEIIGDIVHNTLTEAEIAYFVSGVYINGMSDGEIADLIKAMVKFGKQLKLSGAVYDKHSIGGIAGNRTTPLVISICSAAGLIMPKTSSRAITSAAGTADVMEEFSAVEFSLGEIKKIIKKVNACLVWGGALGLAPADDKIIRVERLISLDPEAQLIASILSKKLAVKSKGVLIDISYGPSAKVLTKKDAERLGERFRRIAKIVRLNLSYVATDGSQPVGNGIGPVLEARDVLSVLSRSPKMPLDLEEKSIFLSGKILEMAKKAKPGNGAKLAKKILDSGEALEKFKQIISAQGGEVELKKLMPAKFCCTISSGKSGYVYEINNKLISSVARSAGCPADKGAGIYLHVHNKDKVSKGSDLITIYADTPEKLSFARKSYEHLKPIMIK